MNWLSPLGKFWHRSKGIKWEAAGGYRSKTTWGFKPTQFICSPVCKDLQSRWSALSGFYFFLLGLWCTCQDNWTVMMMGSTTLRSLLVGSLFHYYRYPTITTCPQNRRQSCSWTSAAQDASSCCSPTRTWSRTGAPTTSGQKASNTGLPHEGTVVIIFCRVPVCVCVLEQTGPPAPDGVSSPSHHLHHVGGPVQTHEPRGQAAARRAPAPLDLAHLEAQLCGRTEACEQNPCRMNGLTLTHAEALLSVFFYFLDPVLRATSEVMWKAQSTWYKKFCFTTVLTS